MNLIEIEKTVGEALDIEALKLELFEGFSYIITHPEDTDINTEFEKALKGRNYDFTFRGITLHLLNEGGRMPFYRAAADITILNGSFSIAKYSIEYSLNGEVLDDYFDIY